MVFLPSMASGGVVVKLLACRARGAGSIPLDATISEIGDPPGFQVAI